MDGYHAGLGEVGQEPADRFATWPQRAARLALVLLALLVMVAAVAPGYSPPPPPPPKIAVAAQAGTAVGAVEDDNDLRLYRVINARLRQGEPYYRVATEEQRAHNYPVRPGLTVRLPTLAFAAVLLGDRGMIVLGIGLFVALLLAMYRRLNDEPGGAARAPLALALLLLGIASGLDHHYNVLHEVWAAQLIALSLALHQSGTDPAARRWGWAWLVGALALAVRELALPYVLLMAASAGWRRDWREAGAWLGLVLLFGLALLVHLHLAAGYVRPTDPTSPSWLAVRGIAGLLYKVINSTPLTLLPLGLAGPLVILALFGWAGWDAPLGRLGFLLTGGYALGFMLFGRDNNFYWGLIIAPVLFMGAAFAPPALQSLWRAARWSAAPGRPVPA